MRADTTFMAVNLGRGSFSCLLFASWRLPRATAEPLPLGADVNIDDNLAVADATGVGDAAADASIIGVGVLLCQVRQPRPRPPAPNLGSSRSTGNSVT